MATFTGMHDTLDILCCHVQHRRPPFVHITFTTTSCTCPTQAAASTAKSSPGHSPAAAARSSSCRQATTCGGAEAGCCKPLVGRQSLFSVQGIMCCPLPVTPGYHQPLSFDILTRPVLRKQVGRLAGWQEDSMLRSRKHLYAARTLTTSRPRMSISCRSSTVLQRRVSRMKNSKLTAASSSR